MTSSSRQNPGPASELPVKSKPLIEGKTFENPWATWVKTNFSLGRVRQFLQTPNESNVPKNQQELDRLLPIIPPNFDPPAAETVLKATWLGHATVLVQSCQRNVLTDPVFSARCSPLSFVGSKRYRPPPCTVEQLPKIDVVVISHNHYDHLDSKTVTDLKRVQIQAYASEPLWFVPLRLKPWFLSCGFSPEKVFELNWWDEHDMTDGPSPLKIHCLPAQHWSTRNLRDWNTTLWCGWAIDFGSQKFYFAGDTGYCPEFKTIGHYLGPFDLAAIPIGCYAPRWFMKNQHISPEEAVDIHKDVKSKLSIGIHWGTYQMGSTEPFMQPRELLIKAVNEAGLKAQFISPEHGQSVTVPISG